MDNHSARALDNPIWHALTTHHSAWAQGGADARRYVASAGPFAAVVAPTAQAEAELVELVTADESLYLVGIAPPLSAAWKLEKQTAILQMICHAPLEEIAGEGEIIPLSEADVPAMLDLTALVYPAFFRTRTAELGAYLGIYQQGRLAAMAGERFHLTGYREISAVCTHPDFLGRGYARRLIARLVNAILERDETPFLHVDGGNERAITLYERLGFSLRRSIPLWFVRRQA